MGIFRDPSRRCLCPFEIKPLRGERTRRVFRILSGEDRIRFDQISNKAGLKAFELMQRILCAGIAG